MNLPNNKVLYDRDLLYIEITVLDEFAMPLWENAQQMLSSGNLELNASMK